MDLNSENFEFIDETEEENSFNNTEQEQYEAAYRLWEEGKYDEGLIAFQQLYNLNSKYTLRKWVCMVAEYLGEQKRFAESIDWYRHASYINQAENPEEDLQYYAPDYVDQKIQSLKLNNNLKDYKIAVYAICGNEINNLEEWFKSMWEADYICVLDTGSTDGSYELLKKYQQEHPTKVFVDQKIYSPWRFDTPRNDSLKLVPAEADICICTDPDERLVPNWADKVRLGWHDGCERMYYLYAWSHLENGDPARLFWYDKIHANNGQWYWKYPVHEALTHPKYNHVDLQPDQYVFLDSNYIMLHHYPTYKKERTNYLNLLKIRLEENPTEFYSYIYLSHEYKYQEQWQNCIDFIKQYTLPFYKEHNVQKLYFSNAYMFLGDCYYMLHNYTEAEKCYNQGIQCDVTYRDNYIKLASLYLVMQKFDKAVQMLNEGFLKSERYINFLEEDTSWNYKPWELLAIAYYNLHKKEVAQSYITLAYNMNPQNQQLQEYYRKIFE